MVDETFNDVAALSDKAASPPPPENIPGSPGSPPPEPENPPVELAALQQELAELKKSLRGILTQETLSGTEQIRCELQSTAAQRDHLHGELKLLQRNNQLQKLASGSGFNDVEFLDFLLQKHQIDPDDNTGATRFLQEFKAANPRYFSLPLKPGSGSRPGTNLHNGVSELPHGANRMAALESMLAGAPEIF